MNTIKQNLITARQLIEKPENWMQGDYSNDEGTCFCILGAIAKAKNVDASWEIIICEESEYLRNLVSQELEKYKHFGADKPTIAIYNDNHTHEEVIQFLDKAIASIEDDEE